LIHTFFLTHTVGGVFLNPEDKALYDEMVRLQGLGSNTPMGVPYTGDEIMAIVRGASSGGIFPVLDGFCQDKAQSFLPHLKARTPPISLGSKSARSGLRNNGSDGCGDDEPGDDENDDEDEKDS
nr:hypothetical protein [Tanacetum cinerariifolium]